MNKSISVVIVEDEASMAMCLEMVLRRAGFDIRANVGTGEEAINETGRVCPDVVLMDISLEGDIDGINAAQRIRIQKKRKNQIIFMTGYSNPEMKRRAQEVQPLAYLEKPFEFSELIRILNTLHPA